MTQIEKPQAPTFTPDETDQINVLKERCSSLRRRALFFIAFRRVGIGFGVLGACLSIGWAILQVSLFSRSPDDSAVTIGGLGFLYSVLILMTAVVVSPRRFELDVKDMEDEIDLRQMKSASLEQKAHKLLRIQQSQLARYLDVILQQSRGIFVVGIAAMLVGVGVVVFTIWQTKHMRPDVDTWQKAIVAVVGSIGAILTNYIAAIYLKMFSDIGAAVQKSVGSLSQSNNINFANVLAANITSEDARNETLKEIAVGISKLVPSG